jgi:DNA polymerase-1
MIKIDKKIRESEIRAKLLIQVHDELLLECPEKEESNVKKQISFEMENASDPLIKFTIPLTVEVKSAQNWSAAH